MIAMNKALPNAKHTLEYEETKTKEGYLQIVPNEKNWKFARSMLFNKLAKDGTECWEFIQTQMTDFFDYLEIAREHVRPRLRKRIQFMDVGCGSGNILDYVRVYGHLRKSYDMPRFETYGIEHNPLLAEIANRNHTVQYIDAREATNYGCMDIIFFYWPILTRSAMEVLEDKIIDQMHVGAVLIARNGCNPENRAKDKRLKLLDEPYGTRIYLKVKDNKKK